MLDRPLNPAAPDELEVSVFGPGYGEAIALHIGEGKWILVDSCVEPDSEWPAPLNYLHNLKVDVEQAVKLVVATHWHDDHIRGMSTILSQCKSASLVISSALEAAEFLKLVTLYSKQTMVRSSGLDEFTQGFQILEARKQRGVQYNPAHLAMANRLLYRDQIRVSFKTVEAAVCALSPSDASLLKVQLAFAQLLPEETERRKRITSPTPNHAAVVLWVEVDQHRILLGSDLERTADPKTGWTVIVDESPVISEKASVFKIPHHGSESAHDERVWPELVSKEPCAVLSPFHKGRTSLPTSADVKRISELTPHAYATAPVRYRQQRRHPRVVKDFGTSDTKPPKRSAWLGTWQASPKD